MPNRFLGSSIGKKTLMGLTGLVLFGFVVVHMLGNLQIFLGPEVLNGYAEKLEDLGELLWVARAVLLTSLVVHVFLAVWLTRENAAARPTAYAVKNTVQASYASRTMLMTGLIVLGFIIYHLLHFTFGVTHPQYSHLLDKDGHEDIYSMVVLSFRQLPVAIGYVLAMLPLAMHLGHGVQSLFQSLGLNHPKYTPTIKFVGRAAALAIFIGNTSIPLAAQIGWLKLPGGG